MSTPRIGGRDHPNAPDNLPDDYDELEKFGWDTGDFTIVKPKKDDEPDDDDDEEE
jgi:hypothetical protein